MLQPLRMPPNMMKPPPDERFAKFRCAPPCDAGGSSAEWLCFSHHQQRGAGWVADSERTLTFVANTTHGAEAMFSVRVFGPRSLSAGALRASVRTGAYVLDVAVLR
jgi:hypothetical protein